MKIGTCFKCGAADHTTRSCKATPSLQASGIAVHVHGQNFFSDNHIVSTIYSRTPLLECCVQPQNKMPYSHISTQKLLMVSILNYFTCYRSQVLFHLLNVSFVKRWVICPNHVLKIQEAYIQEAMILNLYITVHTEYSILRHFGAPLVHSLFYYLNFYEVVLEKSNKNLS